MMDINLLMTQFRKEQKLLFMKKNFLELKIKSYLFMKKI